MKTRFYWILTGWVIIATLMLSACGTSAPAGTDANSANSAATSSPVSSASGENSTPAKPQGELVTALPSFGNEGFLPWKSDMYGSQLINLVYDMLIYYDEINRSYIPGLAESWELSPDAMTTTFHVRKGVQFHEGWGELTAADVKYTMEQQAKSNIGLTVTKQIANMETPDTYTLVVKMKKAQPIFFTAFSAGNSGAMQGIVCKNYIDTVSDTTASQKPVGTGPFTLAEKKSGEYMKFEAVDSHWRVVAEFKSLIVRLVPEVSTTVAMLKTHEIDMVRVPAEQVAGLKAAGLATEASPAGGIVLGLVWGGICLPEDPRYDPAYHNKDPWVDIRVRKAMSMAIDRQAICDAIFAGGAFPTGAALFSAGMAEYQYSYDPAAAKQLLIDAGYPNGFSFKAMSYTLQGVPETPRLVEALSGYWKQIGLDPQITVMDYAAYSPGRNALKITGEIAVMQVTMRADMLDYAGLHFMPGGIVFQFQDEGSYAIWKEGSAKLDAKEREEYVEKLNQYLHENYLGGIVKTAYCFAWNSDKIGPYVHSGADAPEYYEYVRHAQPLNTFRLFTPWEGR